MNLRDLLMAFTTLGYAVSAVGYAANFLRRDRVRQRVGTWGLLVAWGLHTVLLGGLTVAAGKVPLTNEVLPSLCAWLVVIAYLYIELSTGDRFLGALVVPIVTLLHLLGALHMVSMGHVPRVAFSGVWFQLHVLGFILAYAALAISCVSAIMYVMLLEEIQEKHLGFFYERLPSLGTLDQINNRAATFGFAFLTAGAVAGTVWSYVDLHRLSSVWMEPAFVPLLATWVIYAGHLIARWVAGWQGRRAALLSIFGFALVVLTFPVVGVLFSGKHPSGQ